MLGGRRKGTFFLKLFATLIVRDFTAVSGRRGQQVDLGTIVRDALRVVNSDDAVSNAFVALRTTIEKSSVSRRDQALMANTKLTLDCQRF